MASNKLSTLTVGGTKYSLRGSVYFVEGTQTAATGAWTGTLPEVNELYDGLTIAYYLPYAGSGNATLNLTLGTATSGSGAVNCYYQGNSRLTTHYGAGSVIFMTYASAGSISVAGTATTDARWYAGQNYADGNTRYGDCDTAAATAAKAANFSYYSLLVKSYCIIRMRYANTSQTALTMNINGAGAKPIYINGTASSTSNYTLPAGTYLVYYDGTNYYFRTDGKIPNIGTVSINSSTGTTTATTVVTGVTTAAQTVVTGASATAAAATAFNSDTFVKSVTTAAQTVVTGVTTAAQTVVTGGSTTAPTQRTVVTGTTVSNEVLSFLTNTASHITTNPYTSLTTASIGKTTAVSTASIGKTTAVTTGTALTSIKTTANAITGLTTASIGKTTAVTTGSINSTKVTTTSVTNVAQYTM